MRLWIQALLAAGLTAAVLVAAAVYLPAAAPVVDRLGLAGLFERIGITSARATEAEGGGQGEGRGGSGAGPAPVIAVRPELRPLRSSVAAIGTARSAQAVTVASELSGRLSRMAVASGDRVEEGALIAELESEAARIALERADVALEQARADYERIERLRESGAGTDVQREQAEVVLRQAELEQRDAAYILSQHRIMAPIAGWIGIIDATPGRLLSAGDEIVRIEDRSSLVVDFQVPERVVSLIEPGMPIAAAPLAQPDQPLDGRIVALDNRVDPASRSLTVQASIDNSEDRLRAGMAIGITLEFVGAPAPSVDPLAIQWSSDGSFLWVVRDGTAERVPARILQREADAVLIEAALEDGDLVVTEGVQALRPGAAVAVQDPMN